MNGGKVLVLQWILGDCNFTEIVIYTYFASDYLEEAAMYNPIATSTEIII